jgi:predicted GTPase
MPKVITIIGQKKVGKTTLFRQIIKRYSLDDSKIISPVINYAEEKINIENKIYQLIDTPAFILSPKTEIEKGIRNQTEELLKKSDLIL